MSVKERQRNYRERQKVHGKKALTIQLGTEVYDVLNQIKSQSNETFSTLIEMAVTSSYSWSFSESKKQQRDTVKALGGKNSKAQKLRDRIFEENEAAMANKRKDGIKRREQIMDVALKIFAEKGFRATPVEEIIKQVGIVRRTFYLHFHSKDDLMMGIIIKNMRIFYDLFDKTIDRCKAAKTSEEVKKAVVLYGSQAVMYPGLSLFAKVMLSEVVGLQGPFWEFTEACFEDLINQIMESLSIVQKKGLLNSHINTLVMALVLVGGIKEGLYHSVVREYDFDINTFIDTGVDIIANGVF